MPSKKKKYNARFPAGRIKKIMQTDEEVGKVAQAVPVIISRTLELFVESLLTKSMQITLARNAKTLTPSHMKQCILSESRFDFLKDLVKDIPDASIQEDNENNLLCDDASKMGPSRVESESAPALVPSLERAGNSRTSRKEKREERRTNESRVGAAHTCSSSKKLDRTLDKPTTSSSSSTSTSRTPVIQYGPSVAQAESTKLSFSVESLLSQPSKPDSTDMRLTVAIPSCSTSGGGIISSTPIPGGITVPPISGGIVPSHSNPGLNLTTHSLGVPPPLVPFMQPYGSSNSSAGDALCIDEDYDN
ncbi:unnamed protein product [Acanthoscelides obtectus]|uniref:Transcription factor CBF/NF-Y/archaeal histone domain-containing protein n=1 Tax=Acanthoscelides obtectus TaxID=200917 RepID=A0A9P0K392_ACAOB|nr:unnamed protein product [Acanthoscelides obtectus]CAK1658719.1 Dr1-associated corepressor [Acanthoscelides obtectus]